MIAAGNCGWVNGSLLVATAAVFGRSEAGSVASQCANGTRLSITGRLTSKMFFRPLPNAAGAPPAPSTNA